MLPLKSVEELRETELQIVKAFSLVFASPNGMLVLDKLTDEFCNRTSIVPGDPYATHAREGAREVILYIQHMIETGDRNA